MFCSQESTLLLKSIQSATLELLDFVTKLLAVNTIVFPFCFSPLVCLSTKQPVLGYYFFLKENVFHTSHSERKMFAVLAFVFFPKKKVQKLTRPSKTKFNR